MSFNREMKSVWKSGYIEKNVSLPDGTIINYGEGKANGKQPILLIHGQTTMWKDYSTVLAKLTEEFHVYAVDCHGHGKSSKKRDDYKAKKIGKDFAWFIDHIIGHPVIVSGHSSGGLIAAWLAANTPQSVCGAVLEDPPFFSTEKGGRWESSFAYVDSCEPIHRFFNQTDETDWVLFYLKNAAWGKFVGEKGMSKMIAYASKYRYKHPGKPLHYFFLPESVNRMFLFMDEYDPWFGHTFYDSSWFDDYDQTDVLKRITCPTTLIHTKWSFDENGILMAAMSGEDAAKANGLVRDCILVNLDCGHNSHVEKPDEFLQIVYGLKKRL